MTPSSTTTRSPPTFAATTGVPHAAASSATSPNDSVRDGTTHDVGSAVVVGQLVRGAGAARNGHACSSPSSSTRVWSTSDLGLALGTARPTHHEEPGPRRRRARASASIARSTPFSGWMRPTNSSTGWASRRSVRRASARSPGEKSAASTPCGTMTDPFGIGAVVADELVTFLVGRRDHEVGAAHDFGLDARPQRTSSSSPARLRPSRGRASGTW